MNIGDTVKVFSSTSDYDGQTGRITYISSVPGAPAPFVVQFGDAISEPFSKRELLSLKPIEPLWREHPIETGNAPHGASSFVQMYIGRVIASRFMNGERRRITRAGIKELRRMGNKLTAETDSIMLNIYTESSCLQCGKLVCSHR